MTVSIINVTQEELIEAKSALLASLRLDENELRNRVLSETATAHERAELLRLDEIYFLMREQD